MRTCQTEIIYRRRGLMDDGEKEFSTRDRDSDNGCVKGHSPSMLLDRVYIMACMHVGMNVALQF